MTDSTNTTDDKAMPPASAGSVRERITEYLSLGGLFNPESMQHENVLALLIDCRDEVDNLRLTDAEGEAIEEAVKVFDEFAGDEIYAGTLRGLLARTKND